MRISTRISLVTALALGTILPLTATASDLGYTYVEARYLDIDSGDKGSADGATAIGWFRFHENVFAIGQIVASESDSGTDVTTGVLGTGFIMPLSARWDAVAIATWRSTEIDSVARDVSETGYGAQLGLRGMPIDKFEARAFVNYVDVIDDSTSVFVSGDYFFSPKLAAGIAAEFGDAADTISLGVRYSFGL